MHLFKTLKETEPEIFPKNTIRVAVLIGQSSFCSLLPKLSKHCDLIVFNDINPYLIQHTKKLLALLQISTSRQDFERRYEASKGNLFDDFEPSQATPDLAMRKLTLGEDHFLYSDSNFKASQKAALKLRFAFSHVNLFHRDRKKFFELFHRRKCQITVFNATNLFEWSAKISLAHVKSEKQWKPNTVIKTIFAQMKKYHPMIMFSTRENAVESCALKTQFCLSSEEYFKINKLAAAKFLEEKFPKPTSTPKSILPEQSSTLQVDEPLEFTTRDQDLLLWQDTENPNLFTPYYHGINKRDPHVKQELHDAQATKQMNVHAHTS